MKVTLLMAITLDGKIAKDSDHFPDWTGKEDKKLFMNLTQKAGCLIMGSKTFDTIGRALPKRKNIIMTRSVGKYEAKFSEKIFDISHPIKGEDEKIKNLEFTDLSPKKILEKLESEGFENIILAGGAQINTLFAKENLIDALKITISPLLFGNGISLFTEEVDLNLKLNSLELLTENLVLADYSVEK